MNEGGKYAKKLFQNKKILYKNYYNGFYIFPWFDARSFFFIFAKTWDQRKNRKNLTTPNLIWKINSIQWSDWFGWNVFIFFKIIELAKINLR